MHFSEKKITVILFFTFLLIYSSGSFSKIPFGDCIGFALYTERSEFIDSTSTYAHFLYSNSLVLSSKILPFIESSEIARGFTILSAASCIPILYKTCLILTKNSFASITSSIVFGLSFSFWKNASIIEIYTFNLLIVAIFVYYTVAAIIEKKNRLYIAGSIILGVSLFSHIQNILMYPAFILLILLKSSNKIRFISLSILGILFLSLFIFPIKNNDALSSVYSSGIVSEKISETNILKSLILAMGYLFYNFWHFLVFSIFGMIILYKINKQIFFFLIASAIPIFIFSIIFGVSDNYVYFIPFNYIISLFISIGMCYLFSFRIRKWMAASSIIIPALYFFTYKTISHIPQIEKFDQAKSYKGGLKYYLLPWMNDNVGILEFIIDKKTSPEPIDWMKIGAEEYIDLLKSKGYTEKEIRQL